MMQFYLGTPESTIGDKFENRRIFYRQSDNIMALGITPPVMRILSKGFLFTGFSPVNKDN
jgi:hypothetical protein